MWSYFVQQVWKSIFKLAGKKKNILFFLAQLPTHQQLFAACAPALSLSLSFPFCLWIINMELKPNIAFKTKKSKQANEVN